MIINCQQMAVLQRVEWNNPDRIGYVDTIDVPVRSFTRFKNKLSCVF